MENTMKYTQALLAVLLLAPLAGAQTKDTEDAVRARYGEILQRIAADPARYTEKWRPQYHFSAPQDWINDPNGLVFFDGKYRMSFQHRHPLFQGMSWGSAVSTDLVHWQVLPPAILKDDLGDIFSGTAAVDWKDTSGFFSGKPGLLAMFTYSKSGEVGQTEGLAYSRDGGDTWQKFEGNPVIPNYGTKIFIDPKLFWYEPTKRWIAFVGGHGKMRIYSSPNAREWTFESTVEEIAAGGEVADVFQLPVNGDTNNLKWVWSAGGSWFVVGTFDGHKFTPETDRIPFNAGPNAYALQTWSDMPATDTRRIATYWMTGYSRKPELTGSWCGALTLPRELSLLKPANGSYRIAQRPVRELESLRDKVHSVEPRAIKAGETLLPGIGGSTVEIVAEFKLGTAKRFGLKLLKSGKEETLVGYDAGSKRMFIDRSRSGYTRLLDYAKSYSVELLPDDNRIRLHIFADVSIVELYGNDGVANMTAMVLPSPASKDIAIFAEGGEVQLTKLDAYELKSIWGGKPALTSTGEVAPAESTNPFEAQFISNVSRWVPFSDAAWKFVSGGLEGRRNKLDGDARPMRYVAETKAMNGTLEADITLEKGAVAGLSIRDDGNCYVCRRITLDEAARTITFNEQNSYVYTAKLGEAQLPASNDGKYHLKIEAVGAHYRIWLDGLLLMEADDQPQCKSSAGYPLLFVGHGGAVFQNVVFKELSNG
jgi:fructan beta-fructosidase